MPCVPLKLGPMRPEWYLRSAKSPQLLTEQITPPDHSQSAWTCTRDVKRTRCHQLQRQQDWAKNQLFLFGLLPSKKQREIFSWIPQVELVTNTFHTFLFLAGVREGVSVAHMLIFYCWNYRSDGGLVIFSIALVQLNTDTENEALICWLENHSWGRLMKQCKEACSVPSLWINNTNHHPSLVIYSTPEYLKIQLSYYMAYQCFCRESVGLFYI